MAVSGGTFLGLPLMLMVGTEKKSKVLSFVNYCVVIDSSMADLGHEGVWVRDQKDHLSSHRG